MKQHEAVVKVMEENGGYATLGYLYQKTLQVNDVTWKTKTPYASIRRIVQDNRFFFKIKPGLWALITHKEDILKKFQIYNKTKEHDFSHSYFQGLIVEIGNLQNYETYIPAQDKNKKFLDVKLGDITSLDRIYEFTYKDIIRFAKTIDVIWFNKRKMPVNMFEVEHSTDMNNSLIKFAELQDFNIDFKIVADDKRKKSFYEKKERAAFEKIFSRVDFLSYQELAHKHSYEIERIQKYKSEK